MQLILAQYCHCLTSSVHTPLLGPLKGRIRQMQEEDVVCHEERNGEKEIVTENVLVITVSIDAGFLMKKTGRRDLTTSFPNGIPSSRVRG